MKRIILFLIRFYQGMSVLLPARCRFYPSCSEYAYQAISQYGLIKGGLYSLKRLLRCHPLNPGGYDPVHPVRNLVKLTRGAKPFDMKITGSGISNGVKICGNPRLENPRLPNPALAGGGQAR